MKSDNYLYIVWIIIGQPEFRGKCIFLTRLRNNVKGVPHLQLQPDCL